MTETRHPLIPGAETPEGQERIRKALDERQNIDFRAYQMLRRLLKDEGILSEAGLRGALHNLGEERDEARQIASELFEEIDQIVRDRINSDSEVLSALAGRPE